MVNAISAGAFLNTPGVSMYGAGKAALLHFTRSMAAEYASRGIRVNALAPGPVDTDMVRNIGPQRTAGMARSNYLKRLADPDEMVGAVLFMASDAGSFITGDIIHVNGGMWVH